MKKVLLAGILSLVVFTGCGKKETITCKQSQNTNGIAIDAVMIIDIENNRFKEINMTVDVVLPDAYLSKKDTVIKQYEKAYENYDKKYGVTPVVSETDKGVSIKADMTAEQAKKFYGSSNDKATRKDVIDAFAKQGYTCE